MEAWNQCAVLNTSESPSWLTPHMFPTIAFQAELEKNLELKKRPELKSISKTHKKKGYRKFRKIFMC